jgi:flagellar basal-body rod protein FlgG
MIPSLWTAKSGLEAQQTKLDVISNNLANVSTNGFKKSRPIFEDLLYQNIRQPGAVSSEQNTNLPSGLQVGTGVRAVATERLHSQGGLQGTENSRDLAIDGEGFFQVQMPNGDTGYTRDGSFQKDQNGQLVTSSGYLIQPTISIPQNALSITVAKDGVVSVTQPGTTQSAVVGQIQLSTFVNTSGLQSIGENLYLETDASGPANENQPGLNGTGKLLQGYVETSNVNVVEEMVSMIQTQRAYEINSKAVKTSDEMLARLTQL